MKKIARHRVRGDHIIPGDRTGDDIVRPVELRLFGVQHAINNRLDPLRQVAGEDRFHPVLELRLQPFVDMALQFRAQAPLELVPHQRSDPCREASQGTIEKR